MKKEEKKQKPKKEVEENNLNAPDYKEELKIEEKLEGK